MKLQSNLIPVPPLPQSFPRLTLVSVTPDTPDDDPEPPTPPPASSAGVLLISSLQDEVMQRNESALFPIAA